MSLWTPCCNGIRDAMLATIASHYRTHLSLPAPSLSTNQAVVSRQTGGHRAGINPSHADYTILLPTTSAVQAILFLGSSQSWGPAPQPSKLACASQSFSQHGTHRRGFRSNVKYPRNFNEPVFDRTTSLSSSIFDSLNSSCDRECVYSPLSSWPL